MIIISALAAAAWLFVLSRLDPHRRDKGSTPLLVLFVFAGVASGFVALFAYVIVGPVWELLFGWTWGTAWDFCHHFFLVGPVEELAKFALFFVVSAGFSTIREPRDGLLQAAAVGLGFAVAENVGYGWEYGLATMLRRSVFTSLGHMILASIWGSRWALAFYEERRRNGRIDLRPTAAAVGLAALDHGFYNLMLSIDGSLSISADIVTLFFALVMLVAFGNRSPYRRMGLWNWKAAIPELEAALRKNPSSYLLRRKLGLYLVRAGSYDQALRHLAGCQRLRPRSAEIAFYRAVTMIAADDPGRGRPLLGRALAHLAREAALALYRSLRHLFGDQRLRERLRREIAAAGGPVPSPPTGPGRRPCPSASCAWRPRGPA